MKEIVNFFAGRRYSAVSTNEMQIMGDTQKTPKSLQTKPTLNGGASVLDAFFHDRKSGERTRLPKCKLKSVNCSIEKNYTHLNAKTFSTWSLEVSLKLLRRITRVSVDRW